MFSLTFSSKLDFENSLKAITNKDYYEADIQLRNLYNKYSVNSGKDSYQRVSIISLGLLRGSYVNKGKLSNIYKELDKSYPLEISNQIKEVLNDYKNGNDINFENINGLSEKEIRLLARVKLAFSVILALYKMILWLVQHRLMTSVYCINIV